MIVTILAQSTTTNPTGPEFGKASPLGLVIILVLLAGTALLIRSMNKHIKGLPATFSPEHPEPDQAADDGTDPGAADSDSDVSATSETSESKSPKPEAAAKSEPPAST
jgi:hypothetical protein